VITEQPGWAPLEDCTSFGRVYATYGGVFVAMSLLWGWWIDGVRPDRFDILGATIALIGVAIIMYAPRS
jgi:small multidrug resistance family-3 protein